ncbi:tetratricopeptide repeat protein [Salinibacterium sp. G-O1]|uniref:tetratricopeptide repeat protein n=1 Tax=Salinibacterium sp. G-O1 TaxID=3046208 RepID=UPI0024B8E0F3|nr:tetratricopeptide repeat protein [Salinibacterium sp. G-O1]MDJ0335518.1 tetratricopeptide repeat protein [Salinibacterium sp. G-O1]
MSSDWQARVSDLWAAADGMAELDVVAAMDALVAERAPDDASAVFEAASARDYAGLEAEAEPLYRRAIELGLDAATLPRAVIQLASTLRNLGRPDESIRMLERQLHEHPADEWTGPSAAFLALALASRGDERDAASVALAALADYLPVYSASVRGYAIDLAR